MRVVFGVKTEIEQRKFELTHHLHAAKKAAGTEQPIEQFVGHRLAAKVMTRNPWQDLAPPGEVLHELARQLHRIPRHAVDSGDTRNIDPGQQMMQRVTELVKQRNHVVVVEQRGRIADRRRKITDQVGDRELQSGTELFADRAFIHPRAAAFVLACVKVDKKAADLIALCIADLVESDVGVPYLDTVAARDLQPEQRLRHPEQAIENAFAWKIGSQRLVRDLEAFSLQLFAVETDVPGLEFVPGQLLQFRRVRGLGQK